MRLCLLSGGISVVILFSFADELMSVMYGSTNAAVFVKVMAPFFLLYYFQGPLQAVLQALNLAGAAMMNSFIGAAVKTGLIFVLATRPSLGIMGAALAIVTGMVLVTLLHASTVSKVLPISIKIKEYALCFAVIFICGYVSRIIKHAVHFSGSEAVNLTGWIAMTAILYIALLLLFRLIKREELIRIPVIGKFVTR